MNTIKRKLEDVGLSEKQASVYVAALELGPSPAQNIAEKAGIKRATTYVIIEELMELGLMSSTHKGKKQLFASENPERLKEVLRSQKEVLEQRAARLEELLPQLERINPRKVGEPIVKYYLGKKGVFAMLKEFAEIKDNEVKDLTPVDLYYKNYTDEERDELAKFNQKNKGNFKIFYTGAPRGKELESSTMRKKELTAVDGEKYPFLADVSIYDDKVRFVTMGDKNDMLGVGIDNRDIARTLESLFDLAWGHHKKGSNK